MTAETPGVVQLPSLIRVAADELSQAVNGSAEESPWSSVVCEPGTPTRYEPLAKICTMSVLSTMSLAPETAAARAALLSTLRRAAIMQLLTA